MIPTKEECLNLMKKYNMLENIVNHSLLVNSVALYLSEELNKRGENINLLKVQAGALLHDITKTRSIETGEDHAKAGSALLKILGYNSISEIVRQHVIINDTVNLPGVSEIEVVYYADKRVKHEEVVTLEERFDDLSRIRGKDIFEIGYDPGCPFGNTLSPKKSLFRELSIVTMFFFMR
jgi:putative nucleotidyltransferase with HDIG domain